MSNTQDINNIINTNTGNYNYRNNINTNTGTKRDRIAKVRTVQQQAEKLCRALQNPDGYEYYCKVGWRLNEGVIQNYLEKALNAKHNKPGHNAAKFFGYLCSIDMS